MAETRIDFAKSAHAGFEYILKLSTKSTMKPYRTFEFKDHTRLVITPRPQGEMEMEIRHDYPKSVARNCVRWIADIHHGCATYSEACEFAKAYGGVEMT